MRDVKRWFVTLLVAAGLSGCTAAGDGGDGEGEGATPGPDAGSGGGEERDGSGGDAADLPGFYEITEHTLREGACDSEASEVVGGPPLFEIYEENVGGAPFFFLRACEGVDDCEGSSDEFFSGAFLRPEGTGRYAGSAFLSVGTTSCRLIELAAEAQQDGDAVTVELRTRELDDDLAAGDCSPESAEARADEMTCVELRTVDGVRLP